MFKQVIWSVLFYELFLLNSAVKSVSFMSDLKNSDRIF